MSKIYLKKRFCVIALCVDVSCLRVSINSSLFGQVAVVAKRSLVLWRTRQVVTAVTRLFDDDITDVPAVNYEYMPSLAGKKHGRSSDVDAKSSGAPTSRITFSAVMLSLTFDDNI